MKRLWNIGKEEFSGLLWGLLFLVISSVTGLIFPQFIRWIIDNVLTKKESEKILTMAIGLLGLFVIQAFSSSIRYYFFTASGERIVARLRIKLFTRILAKEVSFFDFHRTGELLSRLSSDCTTLQNAVSVNISMFLRNLGQAIGGLVFMAYTSWQLTVGLVVLLVPVALVMAIYAKYIKRYSKEFQEKLANAGVVAEENLSGIRTVKSFVQEECEQHRYHQAVHSALGVSLSKIRAIAWMVALTMMLGGVAISLVLWYGGNLVVAEKLSVGDIGQFLLYLMLAAFGVAVLGSLWGDMVSSLAASARVFEIIENEKEEKRIGLTYADVKGHLRFNQVSFSYPARKDASVLKNISFEIKEGETVALVGASGSGKTTLGQLIPRFYSPETGEITLDGHLLQSLELNFLRQQIGIVAQEPMLISSTIRENILYGNPEASEHEVKTAAQQANALAFIQAFPDQFETKVGEKGAQLSGGQKQRIALARAILKNPKLLILDEATSNLDSQSEEQVQIALRNLMKGRTCLVIAHRLATIKEADKIIVMGRGEILEVGRHKELIKNEQGHYYQLLQKQI